MRSLRVVSLMLGLGLLLSGSLAGQNFENVPQAKPEATPGATAGLKIGIINVQLAMARTQEGRKASEELQAKFAPKNAELQKLQEDVRGIEEQLRTQERTLSDDARAQLQRDLDQKRKLGTRLQQDLQEELEDAQNGLVQVIGQKMQGIIDRFAQENSLNLIFNVGPGGPIIYATPTVDITDDIIKLYDQTHPVQAAAAPPAQKPPAPKPPAKPTTPPPQQR